MTWTKEARAKSAIARHLKAMMNQRSKFKAAGGMVVQPLSEKARQAREDKSDALFKAGTKKKALKSKGPTMAALKMGVTKKPKTVAARDWKSFAASVSKAHTSQNRDVAMYHVATAKAEMDSLHKKYAGDAAATKALSASLRKLLAFERKLNQKFKHPPSVDNKPLAGVVKALVGAGVFEYSVKAPRVGAIKMPNRNYPSD